MNADERRHDSGKIDVVIVSYKCYDDLERCIASIYEDTSSREFVQDIVVVDNAPDQNYWDNAPELFEDVTVVNNNKNVGFAQAVNIGIRRSSAAYILLLNPDSMIRRNMIARCVTFMDRHPRVGIMGPRIVNIDGSIQGSARGFPDFSTLLFGRASPLSRVFPESRWTRRNVPCLWMVDDKEGFYEVDWVSGAAAVIRRDAIDEVGYFDGRFFMYWEDADLCQRMRRAGWNVVYYCGAEVVHVGGVCTELNFILNEARFHKSAFFLEQKQDRNRWPGHLVLVAVALELHFLVRLLWRTIEDRRRSLARGLRARASKIKVLRIITRLNVGGPAIHVALLTKGLDSGRFESILITGKVSSQEGNMSYLLDGIDDQTIIIPELQREVRLGKDLRSFWRVFRVMKQEKPHIVHTHTAKAGAIGRIAVFVYNLIYGKKARVFHTFHGHIFKGYFSRRRTQLFVWIERLLARITNLIIVLGESQKEELCSKYIIGPSHKFETVKLGLDLDPYFSANEVKGRFRRSLGIDHNTNLVGIVGRLVPIKNHRMFLRSARIFVDQNPDVPVAFLIVGDGELREDLEMFCNQCGLSDHVKFCGWRRDLPNVYADLDILCLTSVNEGTPVSIIEAMASSVPVVSTDAGGVRDLLGTLMPGISEDGFQVRERGILCHQDDPEGFAMGLQFLIQNRRIWEEMCSSACSFVSNAYARERLLNDIQSVYLKMTEQS
jgi:GT2 family glycosyltransferase